MEIKTIKDGTLNDLYVMRYKNFIRLMPIQKMLSQVKIISHNDNNNSQTL